MDDAVVQLRTYSWRGDEGKEKRGQDQEDIPSFLPWRYQYFALPLPGNYTLTIQVLLVLLVHIKVFVDISDSSIRRWRSTALSTDSLFLLHLNGSFFDHQGR